MKISVPRQSPDWVRTSTAAVMTMGMAPGRFLNDAKLHWARKSLKAF